MRPAVARLEPPSHSPRWPKLPAENRFASRRVLFGGRSLLGSDEVDDDGGEDDADAAGATSATECDEGPVVGEGCRGGRGGRPPLCFCSME